MDPKKNKCSIPPEDRDRGRVKTNEGKRKRAAGMVSNSTVERDDYVDYLVSSPSPTDADGLLASNLRCRDVTSRFMHILIRSQDTPVVVSRANLATHLW